MTENDWIERIQAGKLSAFEPLLERYQPLLRSLSGRFFCPGDIITRTELEQAGNLGLMRAAKRFNAGAGVCFITYALPWALGEMKHALRCAVDSTGSYEKHRLIAGKEAALSLQLGRSPKLSELSKACGIEEREIVRVLEAGTPRSADRAEEDNVSLLDMLKGEEGISIERLDLRIALEKIPDSERRVLMLRFFRGKSQKETSDMLGKSQAQISKLENRALDRLRKMLS